MKRHGLSVTVVGAFLTIGGDMNNDFLMVNRRQDLLNDKIRIVIVERALEKTGHEVWKALFENDLEKIKTITISYTLNIEDLKDKIF